MIDFKEFVNKFQIALEKTFGKRVWFVGLQGSYGRGEATETSDIDLVVILDELTAADIETYNKMLEILPHRQLICGFLSGKKEILNWETSDLFQFCYDTKPIKGSLDIVLEKIDGEAVKKAIKMGVCNIYHGCVHNMLYDKNDEIIKGLYKSASFVLQAVYFEKTGEYISRMVELIDKLPAEDKNIAETFMNLKNGEKIKFDEMSLRLFEWAKNRI